MDEIDPPVTFGEWLKRQRKGLDLTQVELSQRAGCSVFAVRKIESDERRPSKQLARLLARALEIPVADQETFTRVARGELNLARLSPPLSATLVRGTPSLKSFRPRINLPVVSTPLVGREAELTALRRLVGDDQCRMLTLVGPGGIGKTRLAIELATRLQGQYEKGVYFVPLAGLRSASYLIPTIADALGLTFRGQTEPRVQLLHYLRDRQALLVLDNAEHLLDGVGLFSEMLACAPNLKLLATSRERLNLQGEWVFEIQGLSVPVLGQIERLEEYGAVALFAQRARQAWASFELGESELPWVVRICQIVEGMPLGIELAAAWVSTLTPQEIAEEVERGLDFLSSAMRDVPERQRSLRAAFDHSWDLLSEEERFVLPRLSVFHGGFKREAAECVAGASLKVLLGLVSKSLVRHYRENGRCDLHEVVRQYALAHFADDPKREETLDRHVDFYQEFIRDRERALNGPAHEDAIREVAEEIDNLRAALEWALGDGEAGSERRVERALQIVGAMYPFWLVRGALRDGYHWMMRALEKSPPVRTAPRARVLARVSVLAYMQGDEETVSSAIEEGVSIFRDLGDKEGLADALLVTGRLRLQIEGLVSGNPVALEEALRLYREIGDKSGVAHALLELGGYLARLSDPTRGRAMVEESAAILQSMGERLDLSRVLNDLGKIAFSQGDYAAAHTYFEQSLAAEKEREGREVDVIGAVEGLALIHQMQGHYESARSGYMEALELSQDFSQRPVTADMLRSLAEVAIFEGDLAEAQSYLDACLQYEEVYQSNWLLAFVRRAQGWLAYYQGNGEMADDFLSESTALSRDVGDCFCLADSLIAAAQVARWSGNRSASREMLRESLELCRQLNYRRSAAKVLQEWAGLDIEMDPEKAVVLFGNAETIRQTIGANIPPVECPGYETDLATVRRKLGVSLFAQRWEEGVNMSLERGLAYALATD